MALKSIKEAKVKNKRVLIRLDLNLKINSRGRVLDDFRMLAVLPTLRYLVRNKAKIIVISHLDRPAGKWDEHTSLRKIARLLSKKLACTVKFCPDIVGAKAQKVTDNLKAGEILMLENLRFDKDEEANDIKFTKKLASLGDIYVNEAFAASHRKHASIIGLPQFLPSYAGVLFENEIKNLNKARQNNAHPFVLIMGGAKISTKLSFFKYFKNLADRILVGGALANNILKVRGFNIGKSLFEPDMARMSKQIAKWQNVILPHDVIVSVGSRVKIKDINLVEDDDQILDLGPKTVDDFKKIIGKAKKIVWNGPVGIAENPKFAKASESIARAVAQSGALSVVGGGDTVILLRKLGIFEKIGWVSTGGGAMLDYLAEGTLIGIKALEG